MNRSWSKQEMATLRRLYANTPTERIAQQLGRPLSATYRMAAKMCLRKSAKYLASPEACRLRRGPHRGIATQFKPGHIPPNKGLRRPGYAPGRMAETQFRRGDRPHTWLPINSTRYSKEGYLQLKLTDTGYAPRDWVGAHILLWEDALGPVPPGYCVVFKDGDKDNIVLNNLEMISRGELMARNTIHNLPQELVGVIMLNGALKRKIRRIAHEK